MANRWSKPARSVFLELPRAQPLGMQGVWGAQPPWSQGVLWGAGPCLAAALDGTAKRKAQPVRPAATVTVALKCRFTAADTQ